MNSKNYKKAIVFQAILIAICGYAAVKAQVASGGGYTLNHSVISSGGGISDDTTNNVYKVTGAIGEAIAGTTSTAAPYSLKGGFFSAQPLAPTAAAVSVRGRVLTTAGRGIRNVLVTMTDAGGLSRTTISSTFGYFSFADVPSGETYIFTVRAKRFTFSQPAQVFSILEDFDEIMFVGNSMSLENYR